MRYSVLTVGVLAATSLLVAGPVAAADDPAGEKDRPAIAVTGGLDRLVPYNNTATVTFTVTADAFPLSRRNVQVCSAPVGEDWVCTASTTARNGRVLATRPKVVTPVQMRLVMPAGATNEEAVSDTVMIRPQVTVSVGRSKSTLTVSVSVAAAQYLVVMRQEGANWVVDRYQRVAATKTTVTGVANGKKYRVTISDTPTLRGATSKAV